MSAVESHYTYRRQRNGSNEATVRAGITTYNGWEKKQTCSKTTFTAVVHGFLAPKRSHVFSMERRHRGWARARWRSPVGSLLTLVRSARAGGDKTRSIHPRGCGCIARPRRTMYQTLTDVYGRLCPELRLTGSASTQATYSPAPLRQTLP